MLQVYRRTPMAKCNFSKTASQLAYQKTGTRNPRLGTRDPYVEPGTWKPSAGTQDPEPIGGTKTWDLYVRSGTQDPICENWDPIPAFTWNTGPITLGTLTLIQLSLNVQFRSVAQLFQTDSGTNLHNVTEEQIA